MPLTSRLFPWCRSLSAGVLLVALFALRLSASSPTPGDMLQTAKTQADAALARADLADYRGWIKFLRFEAETAAARDGAASETAIAKTQRFAEWTARISANPKLLSTLRGVQEWAYESPVDGSGQPFKFVIPSDYDPAHPSPMTVYMHGYSGNHLEHSTGMVDHPGYFEVAVLGRSRGGYYRSLSEADVLHVIDYIQAHWAVDLDHVSLSGGSMGGGGTYYLGSRYPHRWSSGRPSCGYASFAPVGNLLTLPIYSTHSADDYVVSVLHERGPLARLRELGGQVIFDETNGYGHAVWDYKEGNARGSAWEKLQTRPASRTVRHIDYAALDGIAVRGWWGEIVEWGDAPQPARFVLTAGATNTLFADLTNVTRLRLRLAESPFDASRPLQIVVNGTLPLSLPAPLPADAILARADKGWVIETAAPASAFRLHTGGSAGLLYDGTPLLIVYGTTGHEETLAALRAAAEAASKSPNPSWLGDDGEAAPDKVPHFQNLYGHLNVKADRDVTDADIARCHLVLIGTAVQNSVVGRLAAQLPVRLAEHAIACSDGFTLPGADLALGLVHYNPLAPQRLIYWVASENPKIYAAHSVIPQLMAGNSFFGGTPFGGDLLIADAVRSTLVASRSFDSRWKWIARRDDSPLLPATAATRDAFAHAVAEAIRRHANVDFAIVDLPPGSDEAAIAAGVTRVSDILPLYYRSPIGVFEMTGAQLAETARLIAEAKEERLLLVDGPARKLADVNPAAVYRVALPVGTLWTFSAVAKAAPDNYRLTDRDVAGAVERYFESR